MNQVACTNTQALPPTTSTASVSPTAFTKMHVGLITDEEIAFSTKMLLAKQGGKDEVADPKDITSEKSKQDEDAGDKATPYKRGPNKPHISPERILYPKIRAIYKKQEKAIFSTHNLRKHFPNYKAYITQEDPVTHEQITFLGKPIGGGVSLIMIPFLKIAEQKIMDMGLDYAPKEKNIKGFEDRTMAVRSPEDGIVRMSGNIPSFHKYGLGIDIDRSSNSPDHGRGNIPDEVILALVEAGFAAGAHGRPPNSFYLVGDFMHSEMQFPPNSPQGQKIINASPIGMRYWKIVKPMIEKLKQSRKKGKDKDVEKKPHKG